MKNTKIISATLSVLIGQIIFGFSFMFTKIALKYTSPFVLLADRYIMAFIVLTVIMPFLPVKASFKGKKLWKVLLLAIFQPTLYFIFESYGISLTTSTFSSVMIALIPVVTLLCGMVTLREYPKFIQFVFTVMSVLGVIIMAMQGKSQGTVTSLGVLLLFGAVLTAVGYNITSRKISFEFSAFERTYAMAFIGAVFFSIMALSENITEPSRLITPFFTPDYTLALLYLSVASSVIAFILLNYANTYLPVAKTTAFSNVTTVVSVVAGAVFLGETLNVISIFASVMIIVGVWGVQIFTVKEKSI